MRRLGKLAVCLAGGLALSAGLRADDLAVAANPPAANPFAAIAARNVFGLVPPPAPPNPELAKEKGLPKITPTGIQNFVGELQVLFKVSGATVKHGKDQYYVLSEGERQDDIEVEKIDEDKGLVTFDNHGFTQQLPLTKAPEGSGPEPGPAGGSHRPMPHLPPGFHPRGPGGPAGFTRFGEAAARRTAAGANSRDGANGGPPGAYPENSLQRHIYQPPVSHMSADDAEIILAAQHLKAIKDNEPSAPLFPPSAIDKQVGIPSSSQ